MTSAKRGKRISKPEVINVSTHGFRLSIDGQERTIYTTAMPILTPGGQVASPTWLDSIYSYAWFVTFGLSFVVYLLMSPRLHGTSMRTMPS